MKLEIIAMLALGLFITAFAFVNSSGVYEWSGADSQAEEVVSELTGDSYQPWFKPIWKPPSSEIESLFFSLQAAIGGVIIGYFFGYYRKNRAS